MAITRLVGANAISGTLPAANINSTSLGNVDVGKVLQVKQTIKTDTFSTTSSSFVDITGLSVSITPSSSSNKIFVISDVAMGMSNFYNFNWLFRVLRGSTAIGVSTTGTGVNISGGANLYDSGGQHPYLFGNSKYILDTPSTTSATTYKIQATKEDASGTIYVNRKGSADANTGVSSITAMEIAG
tara:strand:+ start:49 stop:603 length:555 start_codon:yes stop_codon:yes gene_type:complete